MQNRKKQNAFTLIECMIAMLILMVTFGGIMSFRYYAVLSAERAETELLAARAAMALSEAWRGQKGATDFDPTKQGFDAHFLITTSDTKGAGTSPSGALHLGSYQVIVEDRQFVAKLMYQNAAGVPNARLLHVVLIWQDDKQTRQQFHLSTLTRT